MITLLRTGSIVALLLCVAQISAAQQRTGSSIALTATLTGHTKKITDIQFSPSGELIAASTEDGKVRLWRNTGEYVATITSDSHSTLGKVNWSADGNKLAITCRQKKSSELAVWEISSKYQPTLSLQIHDAYLVDWSPDSRTLLTQGKDSKLQLWDLDSSTLTKSFDFSTNQVATISFVADGRRILTTFVDGIQQLWDTQTGNLVIAYQPNTSIPGGEIYPSPDVSTISPDKRFVISSNINIYEATSTRLLLSFNGGNFPFSFSPDGKNILTVRFDADEKSHRQSYLTIWEIGSGRELSTFKVPEGIHKIVWSRDGQTLAIVGLTFHTRLIEAATGRESGRLPYGNCWPWQLCGSDGCEPLSFNADGGVVFKQKQPIKLWDAKTATLITELKAARLPLVFSPTDRQLLATRSDDKKSVLLWRLKP